MIAHYRAVAERLEGGAAVTAVTLAATWLPARAVAMLDPAIVLREE